MIFDIGGTQNVNMERYFFMSVAFRHRRRRSANGLCCSSSIRIRKTPTWILPLPLPSPSPRNHPFLYLLLSFRAPPSSLPPSSPPLWVARVWECEDSDPWIRQ